MGTWQQSCHRIRRPTRCLHRWSRPRGRHPNTAGARRSQAEACATANKQATTAEGSVTRRPLAAKGRTRTDADSEFRESKHRSKRAPATAPGRGHATASRPRAVRERETCKPTGVGGTCRRPPQHTSLPSPTHAHNLRWPCEKYRTGMLAARCVNISYDASTTMSDQGPTEHSLWGTRRVGGKQTSNDARRV